MSPSPRLIATDFDGTLLRSDLAISPRTLHALAAARAAGIHLVIATARPFRALRVVLEPAGIEGWAVCQNGAVVYHLPSYERTMAWHMEHSVAHQIVLDLRRNMDGVAFAFEADDVFQCEPAFDPRLQALVPEDVGYGDALALITSPLTKLLAYHPDVTSHDLAAVALGVIGERATVTHSGAPFIEISAAGVTKASGVAAVAETLGVEPADVIAFGDAPNDLPMLLWAGRAVAVANAHADVKAIAGEHAPSNDDDGVAAVIERLLRGE